MNLKVASTFSEIIEGWRLVYRQYVKSALIATNPFSVFTYPEYIGRNSAVILGKNGSQSICSVSAVLDSNHGLPLDAHFQKELDGLRNENKKLIEIGLLANRSEKASPFYMIELLSSIARFGVYSNFHDYVIGVHPRRAKFFHHFFGFNQVGPAKKYHKLHDAEVILLYAGGKDFETMAQKASHAIYFKETELTFESRFRFIALASLLPYKVIIYIGTFFIRLWQRIFPHGNKHEMETAADKLKIKMDSEEPESSANDQSGILNFQSVGTSTINDGLHSEKDEEELSLRNLELEFSLSEEDIKTMIKDESFNHQY
jgi:hypothetical protein